MALVLSAGSGTYHLAGYEASLMVPWGGDADFDWVAPATTADAFIAAVTDASIAAPKSAFRWE